MSAVENQYLYNLDTQTRQELYEKGKSQANLIDEHKFYGKQSMSKLNLAIYVKGKEILIRLCLLIYTKNSRLPENQSI